MTGIGDEIRLLLTVQTLLKDALDFSKFLKVFCGFHVWVGMFVSTAISRCKKISIHHREDTVTEGRADQGSERRSDTISIDSSIDDDGAQYTLFNCHSGALVPQTRLILRPRHRLWPSEAAPRKALTQSQHQTARKLQQKRAALPVWARRNKHQQPREHLRTGWDVRSATPGTTGRVFPNLMNALNCSPRSVLLSKIWERGIS